MPPAPPISGKVGDLGLENKPEFEHLDLEGCSNVKGRAAGFGGECLRQKSLIYKSKVFNA